MLTGTDRDIFGRLTSNNCPITCYRVLDQRVGSGLEELEDSGTFDRVRMRMQLYSS